MILPKEWVEWKLHPTTVEWFKFLDSLEEELKESWKSSRFVGNTEYETISMNSHALGQLELISRLKQAEVQDITEVNYDNK
jgi:hypothetical protein